MGTVTAFPLATVAVDIIPSLKTYGAVGDGVTDDGADVTAAIAAGDFFVPDAHFFTTLPYTATFGGAKWWGQGFIEFNDGASQALNIPGNYCVITEEPTYDVNDWYGFGGDPSKINVAIKHFVTGADSAGTPATGYYFNPNTAAFRSSFHTSAGHNEGTGDTTGRTLQANAYIDNTFAGEGDLANIYLSTIVTANKASATHWSAAPNATLINGQIFASVTGVGLYGIGDIKINDNGHNDVTGFGATFLLQRDGVTGALGGVWTGQFIASTGSKPINTGYFAKGKMDVGLDLTQADLTADAAITLPVGGRVYLGASSTDPYMTTAYGAAYVEYDGTSIIIEPGVGKSIVFKHLPTSSAGLPSGAIWNDTGTLKVA